MTPSASELAADYGEAEAMAFAAVPLHRLAVNQRFRSTDAPFRYGRLVYINQCRALIQWEGYVQTSFTPRTGGTVTFTKKLKPVSAPRDLEVVPVEG